MRDRDTSALAWPGDGAPFTVDLTSLEQFAVSLRQELEQGLIPQVERIKEELAGDAPFLKDERFPEVYSAAHRYEQQRDDVVTRLVVFVQAIHKFSDTAADIAARYRGSDELAAASLSRTGSLFDQPRPARS